MKNKRLNIFLFIITVYSTILHSQHQIKFKRISVDQGLSQVTVACVLQDNLGFVWIGTDDGLNKYDGYKFTVYRNNPDDSLSLSNNYINDILEDIKLGKGTVGRLFYDDSLYNDLEGLAADLKEHPWKLLYRPKKSKREK